MAIRRLWTRQVADCIRNWGRQEKDLVWNWPRLSSVRLEHSDLDWGLFYRGGSVSSQKLLPAPLRLCFSTLPSYVTDGSCVISLEPKFGPSQSVITLVCFPLYPARHRVQSCLRGSSDLPLMFWASLLGSRGLNWGSFVFPFSFTVASFARSKLPSSSPSWPLSLTCSLSLMSIQRFGLMLLASLTSLCCFLYIVRDNKWLRDVSYLFC